MAPLLSPGVARLLNPAPSSSVVVRPPVLRGLPQAPPKEEPSCSGQQHDWQTAWRGAAVGLLAASTVLLSGPLSAEAGDMVKVGTCLLGNCQKALAGCLLDGGCVRDLACLQACNGAPDETACQIKCGDQFADGAVSTFNACAISQKQCVPQRVDEGVFPVPPDCAVDNKFNLESFQGRWYITAGLNELFDVFPCQEHYFAVPTPGKLFGRINWRVPRADGDFSERSVMQGFTQDAATPGVLYNRGNSEKELHYQDTWYVLASKPDSYALIYYRGENDAWKGYGGATVYTRSATLPEELVPELRAAAEAAGLDWSQFKVTDNSCPAHPPKKSLVAELEADVESVGEPVLKSFAKGFTILEQEIESLESEVAKDLRGLEAGVEAELRSEEATLEREAAEAARRIRRFEMDAKMGWWAKVLKPLLDMAEDRLLGDVGEVP